MWISLMMSNLRLSGSRSRGSSSVPPGSPKVSGSILWSASSLKVDFGTRIPRFQCCDHRQTTLLVSLDKLWTISLFVAKSRLMANLSQHIRHFTSALKSFVGLHVGTTKGSNDTSWIAKSVEDSRRDLLRVQKQRKVQSIGILQSLISYESRDTHSNSLHAVP